jgi:hypothetical protein
MQGEVVERALPQGPDEMTRVPVGRRVVGRSWRPYSWVASVPDRPSFLETRRGSLGCSVEGMGDRTLVGHRDEKVDSTFSS